MGGNPGERVKGIKRDKQQQSSLAFSDFRHNVVDCLKLMTYPEELDSLSLWVKINLSFLKLPLSAALLGQ